jgi:uncharacterized membrane protein
MEPTEDGSNYKYGIFYFNKNDNRVIVPKRAKFLGWTFNFAHPVSYLIIAALVVIVIWAKMVKR